MKVLLSFVFALISLVGINAFVTSPTAHPMLGGQHIPATISQAGWRTSNRPSSILATVPSARSTPAATTTRTLLSPSPAAEGSEMMMKKRQVIQKFLSRVRGGGAGKTNNAMAPLVEALGTATLTAMVSMIGSSALGLTGGVKAIGTAATVLMVTLAGFKYSGAHYNPMVTTSLFLQGKVGFGQGLAYVISQVIGGIAGAAFAKSILAPGLLPDPSFTFTKGAALIEMFFTFGLIQTILQTTTNRRQMSKNIFAPAVATLVGLATTFGANLNPAVSWGLTTVTGQDKGSLSLWLLPLIAILPASMMARITDEEEAMAKPAFQSFLPPVPTGFVRSAGAYIQEYVGTFMLTGAVSLALATGSIAAPVAAGFMLLIQILAGGWISGGNYNPAVTLGLFLRKGGDKSKAIGYVISQLLGAGAAAGLVTGAFKEAMVGKALPAVAAGLTEGQAFGAEMLFTGIFLQSILTSESNTLGNITIAGTLAASLLAAGAVSGGGLNPAVASALFFKNATGNQGKMLWLYIVGPLLGSTIVALSYKAVAEKGGLEAAIAKPQ